MNQYHHQQFGKTLVVALCTGAVLCLLFMIMVSSRANIVLLLISTLLLIGAILFSSLTVIVDETHLRWKFGPGFLRKQIPLDEILLAEATTTTLQEGFGIHRTRRGWLYSVSGNQAVAIRLKTGKQFLLGSDEAEKLALVLQQKGPPE
jgi:hypothetical protein